MGTLRPKNGNRERKPVTTEETFTAKDRCVIRCRYDRVGKDGMPGHIRGVDIFRVHDGKMAEKVAYVKG